MSIRDEFDVAWSRGELLQLDGPFNDPLKNQAWTTWKASRAAIVIELPALENFKGDESAHGMLVMCLHQIRATGLTVKP